MRGVNASEKSPYGAPSPKGKAWPTTVVRGSTLEQGVPAAEWDRLLDGLDQLINAAEPGPRRPPD